eukprot:scaffold61712_cov69-Phaeocystis_antarctica.AAC.4
MLCPRAAIATSAGESSARLEQQAAGLHQSIVEERRHRTAHQPAHRLRDVLARRACAHSRRKPARLGLAQQHGTRAPLDAPPQHCVLSRRAAAAANTAAAADATAGAVVIVTGQPCRRLAAPAAALAAPAAGLHAGCHHRDEALLESGGELAQLSHAQQCRGASVQRRRGEALRG